MPEISNEMWALMVQYATRSVGVLLLILLAWLGAGWADNIVRNTCVKAHIDMTLGKFFAKMTRWSIMALAVLTCLSIFGVNTTSFAAVLAAAGLAIGLALQGSLSNFAAGVMLLIFRPFKVGDMVVVCGQTGKVDEIDLFTTTLDTPDNRRLILPNGSVFGTTIENITHHPVRRADVSVGVEYAADIDHTREVLLQAAAAVPDVIANPALQVVLLGLGASSVDWEVRVWCKTQDFLAVKEATIRAVKSSLDQAGIGIPFPQMDVHLTGSTQSSSKPA